MGRLTPPRILYGLLALLLATTLTAAIGALAGATLGKGAQAAMFAPSWLAMLASIVLLIVWMGRPEIRVPAALIPPAAVGFLMAFWRLYDPYYYPGHRRFEAGEDLTGWAIALIAGAVLAAAVTLRRPRAGIPLGVLVLVVCLVAGPIGADGH